MTTPLLTHGVLLRMACGCTAYADAPKGTACVEFNAHAAGCLELAAAVMGASHAGYVVTVNYPHTEPARRRRAYTPAQDRAATLFLVVGLGVLVAAAAMFVLAAVVAMVTS